MPLLLVLATCCGLRLGAGNCVMVVIVVVVVGRVVVNPKRCYALIVAAANLLWS